MAKKIIGTTKNGIEVRQIVNDDHMKAHANVTEAMIAEALSKIDYKPTYWIGSVDMGHIIGEDICVKTTDQDDVRMELRAGRKLPSRVVYGRTAAPTTLLTVGICNDPDDGLPTVFTAFTGQLAPKELADPSLKDTERAEAEAFWATHALVAN